MKTRQILRKLLTKRIRFVPEARDGLRGYRLEAEGAVRPLLAEVVQDVASPTRINNLDKVGGLVPRAAAA